MAYQVDNIINVNLSLTPAGLGFGDFSSALMFAHMGDLKSGVYFNVDTHKDYSTLTEVGKDFKADSDIYLIATRYFANVPKPKQITVWMREHTDDVITMVNKANESIWRYHYFLKRDDFSTLENLLKLGDWGDATEHPIWVTLTIPDIPDSSSTEDMMSKLKEKGNRHMFAGYKTWFSADIEPSQGYAMVQLAAAFNKFKPTGVNTAITGEYQVLPGIVGDSLTTDQYNALKAKNAVFFTPIELAGETDSCRVINSKSMSSYGEYIDDVINLDILKNHLQVDGYNYIANAGTKRALTPLGYAGLLSVLTATCKRFYDNGVLGEGTYVDQDTGEKKVAEFGFVIQSKPEDVYNLTPEQRKRREFPAMRIVVILARAGHTAEINVTVE